MKLAIAKLPEFWRGITRNRDIERSAREWMEGYDAALSYCAEQLDQALSHAAGQEAVVWQNRDAGTDKWYDCSKEYYETLLKHPYDRATMRWQELRALYLTPAQPPASAEVGRDAERYRWLRGFSGRVGSNAEMLLNAIRSQGVLERFDANVDAAMAASSGRKGGG